MREVELKGTVDDPAAARRALETAGARLVYEGRLEDRRYDTPDRQLSARDHVLRLRLALAEMQRPHWVNAKWTGARGLGWGISRRDGRTYVASAPTASDAFMTPVEDLPVQERED